MWSGAGWEPHWLSPLGPLGHRLFYFPSFQVLTFKEITWQTLRVEADATENGDQDPVTTPLRLITNQGRIQIALKRRVSVCVPRARKLVEAGIVALSWSCQELRPPVLCTHWPSILGSAGAVSKSGNPRL